MIIPRGDGFFPQIVRGHVDEGCPHRLVDVASVLAATLGSPVLGKVTWHVTLMRNLLGFMRIPDGYALQNRRYSQ